MKRLALLIAAAAAVLAVAPATAAPPQPGVNLTMDCHGMELDTLVVNATPDRWVLHHYKVEGPGYPGAYTATWEIVPSGDTWQTVFPHHDDGIYRVTYWVKSRAGWFRVSGTLNWFGCAITH